MTETVEKYAGAILSVLGILAIVVPVWIKWGLPKWRSFKHDVTAGRDALVGRDAICDPISGTQLAPALPGIGKRMETIEGALVVLAEQQVTLSDHAMRLGKLETAAVERIAARVETGAAYSAMEAAFRSQPESNGDRDHREDYEDRQDAREERDRSRALPHTDAAALDAASAE